MYWWLPSQASEWMQGPKPPSSQAIWEASIFFKGGYSTSFLLIIHWDSSIPNSLLLLAQFLPPPHMITTLGWCKTNPSPLPLPPPCSSHPLLSPLAMPKRIGMPGPTSLPYSCLVRHHLTKIQAAAHSWGRWGWHFLKLSIGHVLLPPPWGLFLPGSQARRGRRSCQMVQSVKPPQTPPQLQKCIQLERSDYFSRNSS